MKSDFRKHLDKFEALPPDVMLGHIVWFTVNDGAYPLKAISDKFDELLLDSRFLPVETSAFNAFEKACSNSLKVTQPYKLTGDQVGEIMAVREAFKSNEKVVRHLVREVRDSRRARLRFEPVAELVLFREKADSRNKIVRGSGALRSTIWEDRLLPNETTHVKEVIIKWEQEYDRLYNFIDGDKARKILRDYIGFLNGIMMKSGVYFVHVSHERELLKLQEFASSLGNSSKMELMDIPDLGKLRTTVIAAFQEQAARDLQDVVNSITKIRSTRGTITAAAYLKVKAQMENVMGNAMEHMRTFKVTQDVTAGAAEIAMDMLMALEADMRKQLES
jgi:hypothetical protein